VNATNPTDLGERIVPENTALNAAPTFYRIKNVLLITSLSRPALYRRIAAQRFPPPVHLGGRADAGAAAQAGP
jgi:predicted DNA-binding transcriptional regulator AlpA